MALLLQQNISEHTKMAVWKIEEDEAFFLRKVNWQPVIRHPHKRLQHLAGRYLLSLLYPDFPYEDIVIADTRRPYLLSNQYQFSISHCGDYAAVIISTNQQVGIDIELFSVKTELVKHKFLNDNELAYIDSLQAKYSALFSSYQMFTLCWCAKEAVYKWWGNGDIDFRKNIIIRDIDIAQQSLFVLFDKRPVTAELALRLILLPELSIVWTNRNPKKY